MNILLINHYAGSPHHGMEYRPYYFAREWVRLGHNVTIVAASWTHLRASNIETSASIFSDKLDGISYYWLKTPNYRSNGIGRALNIFTFVARLFRYYKRIVEVHRPDVVIASSTHLLDIFPARYISRRTQARLVYEVHDLWPLSLIELGGMSRNHPFIRLLQFAENYACKYSDKVISILPLAKEHFINHGLLPSKYAHVPNGIDKDEWSEVKLKEDTALIEQIVKLRKQGKFLVGYAGAHGIANALHSLIESAKLLEGTNAQVVLVGQGQEKANLMKEVQTQKLNNITFLQTVPKQQVPACLSSMDVLYIGLQAKPIFRFGVGPNKLFDYMMAAKPIIQAIDAGNDLVTEAGCGFTIPPEDPKALADAITKMMTLDESERAAMGARGREFVLKNHDYRVLAERYLKYASEDAH